MGKEWKCVSHLMVCLLIKLEIVEMFLCTQNNLCFSNYKLELFRRKRLIKKPYPLLLSLIVQPSHARLNAWGTLLTSITSQQPGALLR